ncbi:MAG: hypothetical protein KatS3mg068_1286 [Candidatus Sericytochromatia bacterium]|nr:MAG: hypothetical protein KatS3mg068_1286 [Candidatus Sericytochromatia bacterium]
MFVIETNENDIKDTVYSIIFKEISKNQLKKLKNLENNNRKIVIHDYFNSYYNLIKYYYRKK